MKENYICVRVEKLKTASQIVQAENHNSRVTEYNKNINEDKTPYNRTDGNVKYSMLETYKKNLRKVNQERTEAGKSQVRKDHVPCVEYVFTASPDVFRNDNDVNAFYDAVLKYMNRKNIPYKAFLHLDETTPHVHVLALPITKDKENIHTFSAKDLVGGKATLTKLQTDFAECCKKMGLNVKRGKEKSPNKHKELKEYYNEKNQEMYDEFNQILQEMEKSYNDKLDEHEAQIRAEFEEIYQSQKQEIIDDYNGRLKQQRKDLQKKLDEAKELEKRMYNASKSMSQQEILERINVANQLWQINERLYEQLAQRVQETIQNRQKEQVSYDDWDR